MSFASEQLSNGYLRRNMPTIVSKVKVREIIPHLPCLSAHDKETIEAKREAYGNYDSMVLLLDCLKRRENWPDQFIGALEACEHVTIAAEIRAEYQALKGSDPKPGSPPTTVVKAHIHPAPPTTHLSVPESDADSQTAVAPTDSSQGQSEVASEVEDTVTQPEASENPEACVSEEASSAVPEAPKSSEGEGSSPPTTPPPSPVTPHHQPNTAPLKEVNVQLEQENSEADVPDFSGDSGVIPDPEPANVSSGSAPQPLQAEETDPADDPAASPGGARSPSPHQMASDELEEESFQVLTSENSPLQDSIPAPVEVDVSSEFEDTSESQVVQAVPEGLTEPADVDLCSDVEEPVSTSNHVGTLADPCSDNSEPLEMGDLETISAAPVCGPVLSETRSPSPPCQENGLAIDKPEEIPEDSWSQGEPSLQEEQSGVVEASEPEETRDEALSQPEEEHEQEPAEEPPLPLSQKTPAVSVNGKTSSGAAAESGESVPSEPLLTPAQRKTPPRKLSANTKYILTAAGVGACALLVAWRFKH
ncbi:cell surface glycoprotein 1-like [Synchiropus splendidus]|uniref:cell surface glycoprotein 1-like n=1 Tax=Synchiropus splendidus TaxID=270530 RepID=UPI00237E03BF|nr:cell surface glycoprotein 1-like [Synchiropus splendidus]